MIAIIPLMKVIAIISIDVQYLYIQISKYENLSGIDSDNFHRSEINVKYELHVWAILAESALSRQTWDDLSIPLQIFSADISI